MKQKAGWPALVFLAPALIIYTAFSAWPLLATLRLGLYGTDDVGHVSFVGLANFHKLLFDEHWCGAFRNAMANNIEFFAIHTLVQNPVALLLAALLSLRGVRGAAAYRTVLFLPTLLSVVIIGFTWQLILSPLWGVSEKLMTAVGLGDHFGPWLGQEDTALTTIALISVWQFVGMPLMLIYAALIAIPEEVVEAARWRARGLAHLLAHPAAADPADAGPGQHPHLRRQLQRVRPRSTRSRARWPGPTSRPTCWARCSTARSSATSPRPAAPRWARRSPR